MPELKQTYLISGVLGDEVKDRITGLKGIAVSRTEYMNGCVHIGVQMKMREGEIPEVEYVDIANLNVVTPRKKKPTEIPPSGPPLSKKPPRL